MKIFFCTIAIAIGLFLTCPWSLGSEAYVTDTFRISLRRGPSIENKILQFLPSGLPVEVLDSQEGWSRVRPIDLDPTSPEGWVLSRYLITRLPWKTQAETLKETNIRLTGNLAGAEKKLEESTQREQELSGEVKRYSDSLEKSQSKYNKLKTEASGFIGLKSEHDRLKRRVAELEKENEGLKSSQRNRWFALGALVLLCGLMIGLLFGRQEKKRKGYY